MLVTSYISKALPTSNVLQQNKTDNFNLFCYRLYFFLEIPFKYDIKKHGNCDKIEKNTHKPIHGPSR